MSRTRSRTSTLRWRACWSSAPSCSCPSAHRSTYLTATCGERWPCTAHADGVACQAKDLSRRAISVPLCRAGAARKAGMPCYTLYGS